MSKVETKLLKHLEKSINRFQLSASIKEKK